MFLALLLYLLLPLLRTPEFFEPGALNYYTLSRLILFALYVSRNLTLAHLPLSGSLNSLLCDLITLTPDLAFFLLMIWTLAAGSLFILGDLNWLIPPLRLKRYFWFPWEKNIRLGHLPWPSSQWPWHANSFPSLLSLHLFCLLLSYPFLLLGSAAGSGFRLPTNSTNCPSFSGLSPQQQPPSFNFQKARWDDFACYFDSHCPSAEKYSCLFPLLLPLLLFWHWTRPYFPFLSAMSNANLKLGGLLRRKVRLVKDVRLSLPLTEVIKIVRPTSLLRDMPRLSSPRQRLRHGRRHAHLSLLNLCTLSFVLLLALLPHLRPALTSTTLRLPGNRLWSSPTTWGYIFLSSSQRPCVAEPRALKSLIPLSALLSPSLNFSRLARTSPRPLLLAQTKFPISF